MKKYILIIIFITFTSLCLISEVFWENIHISHIPNLYFENKNINIIEESRTLFVNDPTKINLENADLLTTVKKRPEFIEALIKKYWESKIKKLLKRDDIIIHGYGNKFEAFWLDQSYSKNIYFDKNISDNKKILTNISVKNKITLENNGNKWEYILQLRPIDFYKKEQTWDNFFKIILYDNIFDFFNLKIQSNWENYSDWKIQKKYHIQKLQRISNYDTWEKDFSYTFIPYYETKIKLDKWENIIFIDYSIFISSFIYGWYTINIKK